MKKYYNITLSADSAATIKVELTEKEYELIDSISKLLYEESDGLSGTLEIKEVNDTNVIKKKIKKGMIIHCATEEEFHRIGKMINELYPNDIKYEDYDFKAEDEDIFNDRELCFFLKSKEWEYSRLSYYKSTGRKITESTEIE